jgi:dTDP-4-amino-4,6-dideoxygalactose transaminase
MNANSSIPFLDLITPHQELMSELSGVFQTALSAAAFIGGPVVERFEENFARFAAAQHCVGVGSGTDALRFALIAAGVRHGDIVITVPNTFIATTEAISQAGARIAFVDIDERTYNMDPRRLREYIELQCYVDQNTGWLIHRDSGRRVSAIVPVHLYGQMADMDEILSTAERYRLIVIEDACQAHGAEYFSKKLNAWKRAGSMGLAAAFSFYPGKNLGACGEAGAVTTNDQDLGLRIRMLRDHGQAQKYYHDVEGYNGRLDAIQAGILDVKLTHLEAWNDSRRTAGRNYNQLLGFMPSLGVPYEPSWSKAVYHLYVVRVASRANFQRYLADAGIGSAIHYPVPLHLQKAYRHLGYQAGDFPACEAAALQIVSLPMFPGLKFEQQERIANRVTTYFAEADAERTALLAQISNR